MTRNTFYSLPILFYSLEVLSSYWKKIEDGTLWTLRRINQKGEALAALYRLEPSNFLHIRPNDIRTRRLDDYQLLLQDDEQWQAFERDRLAPCFLYEPDFQPFEAPGHEEDAAVSPARIIDLSLEKIEHRFPGGRAGELGDKDVRDLIAAQTFLFQHNYERLNLYRRQTAQRWMRLSLLLSALWVWWALEAVTPAGIRPLHGLFAGAFAYAGFDIAGAPWLVRATLSPLLPAGLTLGAFAVMLAWAAHVQNLYRLRFVGACRGASTAVMKALVSRLDNLLYLSRALIEEIDRGKEDAWDRGALKPWASDIQKLAALVFWCDQRIYAIEEYFRIHTKLIGLCDDGVRETARFKALILTYRNLAAALAAPLLFWATGAAILNWTAPQSAIPPAARFDLICFTLVALGFLVLLRRLHGLIKAQEDHESVNNLISLAATRTMRGYRDSQLYREIAAFITREKRRLLREEEKYRG